MALTMILWGLAAGTDGTRSSLAVHHETFKLLLKICLELLGSVSAGIGLRELRFHLSGILGARPLRSAGSPAALK